VNNRPWTNDNFYSEPPQIYENDQPLALGGLGIEEAAAADDGLMANALDDIEEDAGGGGVDAWDRMIPAT